MVYVISKLLKAITNSMLDLHEKGVSFKMENFHFTEHKNLVLV